MIIGNRRLEWRLERMMRVRGITTVIQLKELLDALAPEIVSQPQLYKLVRQLPNRLNMDLLLALTIALDCTVDDLIAVVDAEPAETGAE